ncbi:mitochondrial carrier domain-containing protein [Globomyces pollinis-pini]|nr:mitochondrial carrier domain-containing protein [Globomyces pollinis-pini]
MFGVLSTESSDVSVDHYDLEVEPTTRRLPNFQWEDETDWPSYFIEQYLQAIISSPLIVIETLTCVQYQKRIEPGEEEESYEAVEGNKAAEPLYLPRLQGDFAEVTRVIMADNQETWSALFKGHLTHFCFRSLFQIIQPTIEETFNDYFDVFEDVNPWTLVLSHAITGTVLSPLELVRTRLIVQSSGHQRKKYFGPFHALWVISQEERPEPHSGILATFYSARLLIPSLLIHSISPLIRYGSICFIEQELGLDTTFTPVLYKVCQLLCLGVEALMMAPVELARKRLFVQRLDGFGQGKLKPATPNDSCIETYDEPYTGLIDCLNSVVKHEGGKGAIQKPQQLNNISTAEWQSVYGGGTSPSPSGANKGMWNGMVGLGIGISSMYRGFWPRYASMLITFISEEITRDDYGW